MMTMKLAMTTKTIMTSIIVILFIAGSIAAGNSISPSKQVIFNNVAGGGTVQEERVLKQFQSALPPGG